MHLQSTLTAVIVIPGLAHACFGVVISSTMVMDLDPHGAIAHVAASLDGALFKILDGLVVIPLRPVFEGASALVVANIAACAVLCTILTSTVLSCVSVIAQTGASSESGEA